jgi:hypothetical protein
MEFQRVWVGAGTLLVTLAIPVTTPGIGPDPRSFLR